MRIRTNSIHCVCSTSLFRSKSTQSWIHDACLIFDFDMNRVCIRCVLISYLLANNGRSCRSWTTASISLLLSNLTLWLKYLLVLWYVNSSATIHCIIHCSTFIKRILSVHVEWVLVWRIASDICLASIWFQLLTRTSRQSYSLWAINWIVIWNYTSTDHS